MSIHSSETLKTEQRKRPASAKNPYEQQKPKKRKKSAVLLVIEEDGNGELEKQMKLHE